MEHNLKHVFSTEVGGSSHFIFSVLGPQKVADNKTYDVRCKFQKSFDRLNLPQSRFFQMTGDEDYAWMYAENVYEITPGDTCSCVYKKNGGFDFSTLRNIRFEVTGVEVNYDDYSMHIKGKSVFQ